MKEKTGSEQWMREKVSIGTGVGNVEPVRRENLKVGESQEEWVGDELKDDQGRGKKK